MDFHVANISDHFRNTREISSPGGRGNAADHLTASHRDKDFAFASKTKQREEVRIAIDAQGNGSRHRSDARERQ